MTDFKVKIGAKEAVLDVQVIVLPLLRSFFLLETHWSLLNNLALGVFFRSTII